MVDNIKNPRYKIDKERLTSYYKRMKIKFHTLSDIQLAAKFLNSQSIGSSYFEVLEIIKYYKDRLSFGKEIFDFALEWIRAQKLRLEYKKYLIQTTYPNDDLALAIDDCISSYFLEYDVILRNLLRKDIREHEIAALYEIFFNDYVANVFTIEELMNRYIDNYPKQFGKDSFDINILTLRFGLSDLIVKDYIKILYSRKEKVDQKNQAYFQEKTSQENVRKFRGTLLERIIKTYLIRKGTLNPKEMEKAIEQFLNSFFKFGNFYEFREIIDILVNSLTDDILTGLTENYKPLYQANYLKMLISSELRANSVLEKRKKLDGVAWINDLKPILKDFLLKFTNRLLNPKSIQVIDKIAQFKLYEKPKSGIGTLYDEDGQSDVDLNELYDINLDIEEYRQRLEEIVNNMELSLIQKKKLIRVKIQEFREIKRKN